MTKDALLELFEKHKDEYFEFDSIQENEKLHKDRTLCGYLYIYNLLKEKFFILAAEHTIIYLNSISQLKELTEENIIYLLRCGILYEYEYGCLSYYCKTLSACFRASSNSKILVDTPAPYISSISSRKAIIFSIKFFNSSLYILNT
jgi:hypothetical protein